MPKPKLFSILIVLLSLVGIILLLAGEFGGFSVYYYERHSCLSGCEYNTGVDTAGMIIGIILLALQLVIALNSVLPTPFLKKLSGTKLIPILGVVTIAMMIMGGVSFGIAYEDADYVWLGEAFYGGLFAGILNTLLAVLSLRMKD